GDLAQAERGQHGGVPGPHPEVAVLAGGDHLVHLLAQEEAHRRDHLQEDLGGERHGYFCIALACSWTSSIVPTMKKACSGTSSSSPLTIMRKLRMLSARLT